MVMLVDLLSLFFRLDLETLATSKGPDDILVGAMALPNAFLHGDILAPRRRAESLKVELFEAISELLNMSLRRMPHYHTTSPNLSTVHNTTRKYA
jgi:hypothetical protein